MMLKRIILQYIAGCVFGVIGFTFLAAVTEILQEVFSTEVFFGGDKSLACSGFLLGLPVGALVGLSVVDRLVFKTKRFNIFGLIAGFIIGQVGMFFGGVYLMDSVHSFIGGALLVLFETVCLILIGYNITGIFFGYRKNTPGRVK